MRYLPLLVLVALVTLPATAQPTPSRAQVNAHIAALCDADPACMARVRARLQARCGRDPACVVDALRHARERRDAQDPSLSDLPAPLQDLVRELMELADQAAGASPEPEESTPETPESETPQSSGDGESGLERRYSLSPEMVPERGVLDGRGAGSATNGSEEAQPSGGDVRVRENLRDRTGALPERERPGYMGSSQSGSGSQGGSGSGSSGSAATPDRPLVHDAVGTTRISGNSDDRVRTLTAPDGAWLIAIRMAERSDDPCFVQAFYTTEDYVTGPNRDESIGDTFLEFDQCGDNGPTLASRNLISMGIENNIPIVGGEPYAVNGDGELVGITTLQVCQRSSNDLVKGLAITGVTLDLGQTPVGTSRYTEEVAEPPTAAQLAQGQTSPQVVTRPVTHRFTRPNCNDWKAERSCSNGKVAVGLEIHYDKRNSGRSQITGLALKCAELDR